MSYFDVGADTELIARRGYSGMGGISDVLTKIGNAVKSGAGAALDFYGAQQQQSGQLTAYQQQAALQAAQKSGTPSWVLPVVAVGGLGLVAFMLMGKKRRNPARGRRRRFVRRRRSRRSRRRR